MQKEPNALRTIGEAAAELELPQHVLRFWETRFKQLKPVKRPGGRRYYRPEDLDLLRGVKALLYGEGYTIRGLQRILKEKGEEFVAGVGRSESSAESARTGLQATPTPATESPAMQSESVAPPVEPPVSASSGIRLIPSREALEGILSDLLESKRILDRSVEEQA